MVSEIQEAEKVATAEVYISEFGLLDAKHIEPGKKYQGRIYRLSAEQVKSLADIVGFTAKYEAPAIRTAYLDVLKTEGNFWLEMDRNANPTELALRYGRDRWSAVEPSGKDKVAFAARPWIKTQYTARFLPEKVLFLIMEQIKIKFDEREHFLVRINFKDRTLGLIAEDSYVEQFPTGAFQVFALPEGHVASIPITEVAGSQTASAGREPAHRSQPQDSGVKYATYSVSEIDRMFKMQAESIMNTLGSKISGQQRSFQEAVESQEKTIGKLADRLTAQIEEARTKLEANTRKAQETAQQQLEGFKKDLNSELDQFRAHINKNVVPIPKAIEDKIKQLETAARAGRADDVRPALLAAAAVIVATTVVSAAALFFSLGKSDELAAVKSELSRLTEKIGK